MIFEFNKIHASGQGLSGYTEMLSEQRIDNRNQPLDEAGLAFTPVHGSFQVQVINKETACTRRTTCLSSSSGLDDDTTFDEPGRDAGRHRRPVGEITLEGQLQLASESADLEFSFANDSSGVLAALGLNTFFTGTTAADMRINAAVLEDVGQTGDQSRWPRGGHGQRRAAGESADHAFGHGRTTVTGPAVRPVDGRDGPGLGACPKRWRKDIGRSSPRWRANTWA